MSQSNATVKEIMTKDVSTLGRNDTLDSADDMMTLGRIRHLPVLDEGAGRGRGQPAGSVPLCPCCCVGIWRERAKEATADAQGQG